MTFKYMKQPLTRSANALTLFVSQALQSILSSWTEQLLSSITKERDRVHAQNSKDDLAADEMAVLDATERMLRSLYAVAIYHVLEQHFIRFFYRQAGTKLKKRQQKEKPHLYDVVGEIKAAWGIDLKNVITATPSPKPRKQPKRRKSWETIDELRMVANCVKHADGQGSDCEKLKSSHADWFDSEFITPLSGDGLKLPNDYLEKAVGAIKEFLSEFKGEIKKIEK